MSVTCPLSVTYDCAVPTVGGVEALALTLDTVQVDVTVSDDGGQPVLEYTVSQTCGWMDGCVSLEVVPQWMDAHFWCHRSQSVAPQ